MRLYAGHWPKRRSRNSDRIGIESQLGSGKLSRTRFREHVADFYERLPRHLSLAMAALVPDSITGIAVEPLLDSITYLHVT
jgi:hypothetical protein